VERTPLRFGLCLFFKMSKLRPLLWIFAAVIVSIVMMHILFIRKYSVRASAIHIIQSLKVNVHKETSDIDPHGNTLNGHLKVEDVLPEVKQEAKAQTLSVSSDSSSKGKAEEKPQMATEPPKNEGEKSDTSKEGPVTKAANGDGKLHSDSSANKELCNKKNQLVGPVAIDQTIPEIEEIVKKYSASHGGWVEKGGKWEPKDCVPKAKVAVIIPFRNRERQLKIFLRHMHPVLYRQSLFYQIFVIEQSGDDPFNRAGLFNIGFKEALKTADFNCFVFSDVDLLPEDDRNSYGCPTSPRHMSVAIDKFDYRLPYEGIFGGVGAFKREDFEKINGFSNLFWGWGGEDDDLYARIRARGFKLTRPSMMIGRYTMIKIFHFQSHGADPNRMNLLQNSASRMDSDGLSTLKYTLRKRLELPLVTVVNVVLSKSMYQ